MFLYTYCMGFMEMTLTDTWMHTCMEYHTSAVCVQIRRGVWGLPYTSFSSINDQMDTIFIAGGCALTLTKAVQYFLLYTCI